MFPLLESAIVLKGKPLTLSLVFRTAIQSSTLDPESPLDAQRSGMPMANGIWNYLFMTARILSSMMRYSRVEL